MSSGSHCFAVVNGVGIHYRQVGHPTPHRLSCSDQR